MAKSKTLLRRGKLKKPRVAEATKRLVQEEFWGEKCPPITNRGAFLTWCANMVDLSQGRKWLEEYLKQTGRSSRGVPDKWINPSVCHRARLKLLGAPFTDTQEALLEQGIADILKHIEAQSEETSIQAHKPTIADHIREKFSEVMGEVEGLLDDHTETTIKGFDVAKWYRDNNVSATVAAKVLAKLKPKLDEVFEVLSDECPPDLFEGYERVDEEVLFDYKEVLHKLIDDTDSFVRNEKRARVPRAPKAPSLEKKLKHINESYQKHSKDWNITSLDPSKILGATELWTLNTKYKLLTVFRADKMGGSLDVARCKIAGFNKNDSFTYRLGRGQKAIGIIEAVMKSSPAAVKDLVKNLKVAPLQERINENTVLMVRRGPRT